MDGSRKHIFMPGIVRSGTTWVSEWLGEHPDISLIRSYLLLYTKQMLINYPTSLYTKPNDFRAMLDSVFSNNLDIGKTTVLDASPGDLDFRNEHISSLISSLCENAKILVLYRDGKNWVHSMLNLPWKSNYNWTAETATEEWISKMKIILGPTPLNTLHIKYEDLLAENGYRKILDFLEIEHAPIISWNSVRPGNTKSTFHDPNKWKSLSLDQIEYMKKMNPHLEAAGYDPI